MVVDGRSITLERDDGNKGKSCSKTKYSSKIRCYNFKERGTT